MLEKIINLIQIKKEITFIEIKNFLRIEKDYLIFFVKMLLKKKILYKKKKDLCINCNSMLCIKKIIYYTLKK